MNRLHLVRHGQAAEDMLDYDDLSPLGEQQMAALGTFYRDQLDDTRLYSGTLVRQQKSARAFLDQAGITAEPTSDPRLNEYDFLDIARQYIPAWQDPERLRTDLAEQASPDRYFLRVFREALFRWFDPDETANYSETWVDFKSRTRGILNDADPNQTHWVFTSGGVISSLIADALALDPPQMIRLNLHLANGSVTTFQSFKGRWRLLSINQMQHLHDKPELVTFR